MAAAAALAVAGCAPVPTEPSGSAAPPTIVTPTISATTPTTPTASATPSQSPTPKPTTSAPKPTTSAPKPTTGDQPFTVRGIVLVNPKHRLSAAYVPAWASSQPNGLSRETNAALRKLIAAAKKRGLTLRVRSGYRSYATQKASYENALKRYPADLAARYFAKPGASEHQTGLSFDLTDAAGARAAAFARTKESAYLAEHATDFGFIVRYPQGKTAITGYDWEPWHLRFVGTGVSSYFAQHPGLTLEEYLGQA